MTSWCDSLLRITLELLPVEKLEKSILVRMTYCLCSERTHLSADFLSCIVYRFTVRLFTSAVWICISCPSTTHASTHIHARTRAYRRPHAQTHTAKHWLKTVRSSQNSFSSIFSVKWVFIYIFFFVCSGGSKTWWKLGELSLTSNNGAKGEFLPWVVHPESWFTVHPARNKLCGKIKFLYMVW